MADEAKELQGAELKETIAKCFQQGYVDSHSADTLANHLLKHAHSLGIVPKAVRANALTQPIVGMISRQYQRQVRTASGRLSHFMKKEVAFKANVEKFIKALDKDLVEFFTTLERQKKIERQLYHLRQRWIRGEKNAFYAWLNYGAELDRRALEKEQAFIEKLYSDFEAWKQYTEQTYQSKKEHYEYALRSYDESLKAMKTLAYEWGVDLTKDYPLPEKVMETLDVLLQEIEVTLESKHQDDVVIDGLQKEIAQLHVLIESKRDIDGQKQLIDDSIVKLKQAYIDGMPLALESEREAKLFVDRSAKINQFLNQPTFGMDKLLELERLGVDVTDLEKELMSVSSFKDYMVSNRLMNPRELQQIAKAWRKVKSTDARFRIDVGEHFEEPIRQQFIEQLQSELGEFDPELVGFWVDRFEQGVFQPEVDFVSKAVNTFSVEESLRNIQSELEEQKTANQLYEKITEQTFSRLYEKEESKLEKVFWKTVEAEYQQAIQAALGHVVEPPSKHQIRQEQRMHHRDVLEARKEFIAEIAQNSIQQIQDEISELSERLESALAASSEKRKTLTSLEDKKALVEQELKVSRLSHMVKTTKQLETLTKQQLELIEDEKKTDYKLQDVYADILKAHEQLIHAKNHSDFTGVQLHSETIKRLEKVQERATHELQAIRDTMAANDLSIAKHQERLMSLCADDPKLQQVLPAHLKSVQTHVKGTKTPKRGLTTHYQSQSSKNGLTPDINTKANEPEVKPKPKKVDVKKKPTL